MPYQLPDSWHITNTHNHLCNEVAVKFTKEDSTFNAEVFCIIDGLMYQWDGEAIGNCALWQTALQLLAVLKVKAYQ